MLIVEFDRPPSWSLDAGRNWGEYKMSVGRGGGVNTERRSGRADFFFGRRALQCTLPSFARIK